MTLKKIAKDTTQVLDQPGTRDYERVSVVNRRETTKRRRDKLNLKPKAVVDTAFRVWNLQLHF